MTRHENPDEANRQAFSRPEAIAGYERTDGLTSAERRLFAEHIAPGATVLDLGVGTGRTVPTLSATASVYIGIDYSAEMIAAGRRLHPDADLRVGDAADLSAFDDHSFDVVVFSFNGIDYLHPDPKRVRCIDEVARVIQPGGRFVFSSHDPRALIRRRTPESGARGTAIAAYQSARRVVDRVPTAAFLRGTGYVHDRVLGGLETHMATPRQVVAEIEPHGFRHIQTVPGEGAKGGRWSTSWWYYVFSHSRRGARPESSRSRR